MKGDPRTAALDMLTAGQLLCKLALAVHRGERSHNVSYATYSRAVAFAIAWCKRQLDTESLPNISDLATTKAGHVLFRWDCSSGRTYELGIGSSDQERAIRRLVEETANELRVEELKANSTNQ